MRKSADYPLMQSQDRASPLAEKLRASKKYGGLYMKTLQRVVADCIARYGEKRADREARNLLHQVWGAYFTARPRYDKLLETIGSQAENRGDTRAAIMPALELHASTWERVPVLNTFYRDVFSVTGTPHMVVDWACGFNPLTIPWMGLPPGARHCAYDIDAEEIAFLAALSAKIPEFSTLHAETRDILVPGDLKSAPPADVVFLLKLLPCLEQQEKGSTASVLKHIRGKHIIVSFPVASLSARRKGFDAFYKEQFKETLAELKFSYTVLRFETEIVFVVRGA